MKKTLSLIAIIVAFGSLAAMQNVSAGGAQMAHEPGFTPGVSCRQQSTVDPQIHQQFMDATEMLRTELLAKRSAYFELMNSTAPDKAEAQQIWSEMSDLQTQIRAKATELGITPMGPGLGGPGPGNGIATPRCNCQNNK